MFAGSSWEAGLDVGGCGMAEVMSWCPETLDVCWRRQVSAAQCGIWGGYPLWGNLCCWSFPAALHDTVSPGLPGAEANRSLHPDSYPRALLKSSIVLVVPHAYGVDLSESRGIHQQQL